MKEIFTVIQNAVADLDGIRWVDFDLGQLDQEKPPVSFPCALIGFDSGDYSLIANDANVGTVRVEVALAFRLRERTHSITEQQYREEGLEHLDTVEAVRVQLTGLSGDTFQGLEYLGFSNDRRADLRVWRLRFACAHYPEAPDSPFEPLPDDVTLDLCLQTEIQ